ncbi:putative F-box domain-containing protein [Helianthus annuus]|nr:putative F-box domain-containing protein [Helianthus annuus]
MLNEGITMADLPVHTIVFEILTRVPAKDVGRSKSVCKQWYALLSTQDFVRMHCSRSLVSSNQRVLLIDDLTCSFIRSSFNRMTMGQAP